VDALGAPEVGHIIVGEEFSAAAVGGPLALVLLLVAHTNVATVGGDLAVICTEDVLAGLHCMSRPIIKIDD
jgi:hypothetical protein